MRPNFFQTHKKASPCPPGPCRAVIAAAGFAPVAPPAGLVSRAGRNGNPDLNKSKPELPTTYGTPINIGCFT